MKLGDRIREIRMRRELSLADLANSTGFSQGYISRVENGHLVPSLEAIEKLAYILLIPAYQFFYDSRVPIDSAIFAKTGIYEAELNSAGKFANFRNRMRLMLCRTK